jgi:hypothetical protein
LVVDLPLRKYYAMSLETIRTILRELPQSGHCPLCGVPLTTDSRSGEHIFAAWMQERFGLGDLKLNIPNFLNKFYRSVRIDICKPCNNNIFSRLEGTVRNALFESNGREGFLARISDHTIVRWLCKILLLNTVKSNWNPDYRELKQGRTAPIVSDGTVNGLSSVRLFLRALIEGKRFLCAFPLTESEHVAVRTFASTYYFEVDTRDDHRYGEFDFLDFPMFPAAYIRLGHICVIMILDGGLHNEYRGHLVFPFYARRLHPLQTLELFGRILYDTLLLPDEFGPVEYFFREPDNTYFMKFKLPYDKFPYCIDHYNEAHLTQIVSRLTMENPDLLFDAERQQMSTKLYGPDGRLWKYPVTDEEWAAVVGVPGVHLHNDTGVKWRQRKIAEEQ